MSHLVSLLPYASYDFKGKPQNPLYGPKYVVGCYGCLRTSGPSLYDNMSPYNEYMKTRKQQIFNSGHLTYLKTCTCIFLKIQFHADRFL